MNTLKFNQIQFNHIGEQNSLKLQEKSVTITENGSSEVKADNGYDGLSKVNVDVNVDLKGSLQDKSVTIIENGTQTITADSEFEGLSSVEVTTDVNTLQGLDLSKINYSKTTNEEINAYYLNVIEKAKEIMADFVYGGNLTNKYNGDKDVVFLPCGTYDRVTNINYAFQSTAIEVFPDNLFFPNAQNAYFALANTYSLRKANVNLPNTTTIGYCFNYCTSLRELIFSAPKAIGQAVNFLLNNYNLKIAKLGYLGGITGWTNFINGSTAIETLFFEGYKKGNLSLSPTAKLTPESIHYIIQNAVDVADGATARTLTLHATAKTNWEASEYYEQDLAVLEEKCITIA